MDIATKPLIIDANEAFPHRPEADSFDFAGVWQAVVAAWRNHLRLIITTAAVTVALVLVYIIVWPPVYMADVTLVSASDKDAQREQFYQNWAVFRRDDLTSEVQLFTAGPVLQEVIRRLNLHYDDVYHPPLSYATHLWTTSLPGRAWRAVKDAIDPPDAGAPTPEQAEQGAVLKDMRSGVAVTQIAESNVGKLTVMGPSRRVKEIADTTVKVYLEQRRARFAREAQAAYDALSVEAAKAHDDLRVLEGRMERYYTHNDMSLMFEKDKVQVSQLLTEASTATDLRAQLAQMKSELATINAQFQREPEEVVSAKLVGVNPIRQSLMDKLAQLQLTRRTLIVHYLPTSPEVVDIDQQMAALEAQAATEDARTVQQTSLVRSAGFDQLRQKRQTLEGQIAGTEASLAVRERHIGELKRTVDQIPAKMRDSHDFGRDHDELEKKYQAIEDKLMIAGVSLATSKSAPPSIEVVENATVPDKASAPQSKLLLFAAVVLGLLAGTVLAVVLDNIRGVVSRTRLARREGTLPLYGVVGRDPDYAERIYTR